MTTKELINTEIEKLSEDELQKAYGVVKTLAESKAGKQKPSFMSRLKRIQIEAPEDTSSHSGERPSFSPQWCVQYGIRVGQG